MQNKFSVIKNFTLKTSFFLMLAFLFVFSFNVSSSLAFFPVTVNQASFQEDPTIVPEVFFTVVFSQPINVSTFTPDKVRLTGTAGGKKVVSISEIAPNNKTTFEVLVSATSPGTIIMTIPAGTTSYDARRFRTISQNNYALYLDSSDNVYTTNDCGLTSCNIVKINSSGVMTVLATVNSNVSDIVVDKLGNVYGVAQQIHKVFKVTPQGNVTTIDSDGKVPVTIAVDQNNNVYVGNNQTKNIIKITPGGIVSSFGSSAGRPVDLTFDKNGNLYSLNVDTKNITKITPGGTRTTIGKTGNSPVGIVVDSKGNIFVTNSTDHTITKITPSGVSSFFADTGLTPHGLTIDPFDNLYVANHTSNYVNKITPSGVVSNIGNTDAFPTKIVLDQSGNLYIVNSEGSSITKISQITLGIKDIFGNTNNNSTSTDNTVTYLDSFPTPTLSLVATPTNVDYNRATFLAWSSTNTTSCTASNNQGNVNWNGNLDPGGSRTVSNIKAETIFTVSCTGTGGTIEESVTVTVNPQAPIVNLNASPRLVPLGGSTNLTWTSTNATSCTASGGWGNERPVNSTEPVVISNITTNTTFTLTCRNSQGVEVPASVVVEVISPISVTLTSDRSSVLAGETVQLTWATTGAPTNCTASGGWSGTKGNSGSQFVTVPQTTTYTLTCTKTGLPTPAISSATVTVLSPLNITLSATPNPLAKGGNVTLAWDRDNADTCTASSIPAGIWSGIKPPTLNTETVNNLQQNTTFTISCTKNGINGSDSKTVTLIAVPEITISANPTSILSGGSTVITWSVTNNPDTCIASNGWSGSKNTNGGNETINNITQNTTFTLACQKGDINIVHSVSVSVIQENISFSNTRVLQGQTTLRWTVTNMKECVATTENPDNGLGWEGPKTSSPSPYTGQTTNVSVTAPDTTDVSLKNRYILTCTGVTSNVKQSKMLSLDINDPASSGVGIPVYQEN